MRNGDWVTLLSRPIPGRAGDRSGEAPQALEIQVFVGRPPAALRFPQLFGQDFQHPVLGFVRIARGARKLRVDLGDPVRTVRRHLLADGEMQSHVQPGIQLPAARRVVSEVGGGRFDDDVVFGVFGNDRHDLLVERLQRVLLLEATPRGAIGLAQLVARLACENHGAFLDAAMIFRRRGYSHKSFTKHRAHSGFNALQT